MAYAPVAFFVYNRPAHTRRTVQALLKNKEAAETDLYIFCDGAKANATAEQLQQIQEVRSYVNSITGFKTITITTQPVNMGLANSVIAGVTSIVNKYGKTIVLEDDIVANVHFLKYMNWALNTYQNDVRVANISAFTFKLGVDKQILKDDSFLLKTAECWGWATWDRAWTQFNPDGAALVAKIEEGNMTSAFNGGDKWPNMQMLKDQVSGKNNSWWIRWNATCFLNELLTLYPTKSFVTNIGLDGSGTHLEEKKLELDDMNNFSYKKVEVKELPVHIWQSFYERGLLPPVVKPPFIRRVLSFGKRTLLKIVR